MKASFAVLFLVCVSLGAVCARQPTPDPIPGKPKPEGPPPAAPAAAPKPEEKKPDAATQPPANQPAKKKPFEELTKNCDVFNGIFRVYTDRVTGAMYLFIKKDQFRREFIYFSHVVDGVVGAGRTRGQFDHEDVFTVVKRYEKVDFVVRNTAYYFDPASPLARAAHANISNAVVATEPIVASNDEGFLINAGGLFLKEVFMQVKHSGGPEDKPVLGRLSDAKTKFIRWGSYPKNAFFVVEYVYEGNAPPRQDDDAKSLQDVTDPRYVSVRVQHTLVAMPENDYQPRPDDARVGYFMTQLTDQTSTDVTPFRDFIHRWYLKKKDPGAPLSEPVEPITWWIENTTPREFRETIRNAALLWNKSFEKIGYKNALVINEQPDDAKWTADDLDHNVLRWTSSPKAPFGGYGPHFVNPRTGQILGADIMLEFSFVKNRVMARHLWDELGMAGLSQAQSASAADPYACMAAEMTQQSLIFGTSMMQLRHAEQVDIDVMIKESLTQLVLHELGHTLGLNHNFRASFLHTPAELQDRALTEKTGLSGSVMDYMPLNLGPDKKRQGQYYITAPGPYDDWAIDYGYSDALSDPDSEATRLGAIAGRSHEKALAFANDADDMRKAGKSIDPRAQIYDMSSDPIAYGHARCELVQPALEKLLATYPKDGRSWQEMTQAYISLTTEESNALTAISRYIGGIYVERAFVGQVKEHAPDPFKPVPVEQQKAAMHALAECAFGPDAWKTSDALLRHLQQQRRGFDFRDFGEDPKVHDRVLKLQRALLDHLLHSNTQNRILDSALYGNGYPLPVMMHDLTQAIMAGEAADAPISTIRQDLQIEYVDRLLGVLKSRTMLPAAQSVALYELQGIEKTFDGMQANAPVVNRPHIAHVLFNIQRGLEEKK